MPSRYYKGPGHQTVDLFTDRSATGQKMRRAVGKTGQWGDRVIPPNTLPFNGERWAPVHVDLDKPARRTNLFDSVRVEQLNRGNFYDFIRPKEKTLILYYNPNNADNVYAAKQFGRAAYRRHPSTYSFGALDCSVDGDLCAREKVSKLPTFKLYSNGYQLSTIVNGKNMTAEQMHMVMKMTPVLNQPMVGVSMGVIRRA